MAKWRKFTMTVEEGAYKQLKLQSKLRNYISVQELIRDLIREKFGKSELERLGEKLERKIKKVI